MNQEFFGMTFYGQHFYCIKTDELYAFWRRIKRPSRSSQTSDIIGWISKPSQYIIVFLARVFMFKLKLFFTFIRELENPPLIFAKEPTSNQLKRLRNGIYGRVKFPLSLQYVFGWTMSVPELWKSCNHERWTFQHLLFDYSQIFIWSMRWFQFLINDCLMNTLSNGRRQSGRFKRHMCLHVCLLRPPPPLARSRGGRQFLFLNRHHTSLLVKLSYTIMIACYQAQ